MAKRFHISGTDRIMTNLNVEKKVMNMASIKGLIKCGIEIFREADKHGAVIVPIRYANLRHSWFAVTKTNTEGKGAKFKGKEAAEMASEHSAAISNAKAVVNTVKEPLLIMGYSANYAVYVHEKKGMHFKRPRSGHKWFEFALYTTQKECLEILRNNTQIK